MTRNETVIIPSYKEVVRCPLCEGKGGGDGPQFDGAYLICERCSGSGLLLVDTINATFRTIERQS